MPARRGLPRNTRTRSTRKDRTIEATTPHLTDSYVARAIDGSLDEQEMAAVRMHLQTCGDCLDAVRDAALLHGVWQTGASTFEPSQTLLDIAAGVMPARIGAAGGVSRGRRPWGLSRRLGLAAACAVIVVVAGVWWRLGNRTDGGNGGTLDGSVLAPIRTAVETASSWGPFVFPGGQHAMEVDGFAYRSGFIALNDSLETSLDRLHVAFERGDASPDVAVWLASGLLVTGQVDAARDLVSHPRVVAQTDARITVLRAIVAYMDRNFGESEALLRRVIDEKPDDPVASIDLAVVLVAQNKRDEARAILEGLKPSLDDASLARRVEALLSELY